MTNVPALVTEFRAIMADPMGSPSEDQMRAYVEHVSSTIPQGGHFYGVWCVEGGKRTLCEFDGCVSYEAYTTAHEAQAEAARLCQQYGAGCYVSAPVPAGLACYNRVSDRIEVATGNDAAVRFHMEGGYIVVTLADCSTADQAIAAIEAGLVEAGILTADDVCDDAWPVWPEDEDASEGTLAPVMVPQQVQQQQANAAPISTVWDPDNKAVRYVPRMCSARSWGAYDQQAEAFHANDAGRTVAFALGVNAQAMCDALNGKSRGVRR